MLVLISERFSEFAQIADHLTDRGIFLLHCPIETAEFVCDKYDTGGVILDLTTRANDGLELLDRVRTIYPEMPIAVIANKKKFPWLTFDYMIEHGDADAMEREILAFCFLNCRFHVLTISGPHLSILQKAVCYHGQMLALSPRQHRVLRCLAYRAPRIVEKGDLLSMCFPTELRTPADLAVLIHGINERAARLGLDPLIVNLYGKGYRIREGLL